MSSFEETTNQALNYIRKKHRLFKMYYIGTKTDITEDPEPNPHIHIYQILLEKY